MRVISAIFACVIAASHVAAVLPRQSWGIVPRQPITDLATVVAQLQKENYEFNWKATKNGNYVGIINGDLVKEKADPAAFTTVSKYVPQPTNGVLVQSHGAQQKQAIAGADGYVMCPVNANSGPPEMANTAVETCDDLTATPAPEDTRGYHVWVSGPDKPNPAISWWVDTTAQLLLPVLGMDKCLDVMQAMANNTYGSCGYRNGVTYLEDPVKNLGIYVGFQPLAAS